MNSVFKSVVCAVLLVVVGHSQALQAQQPEELLPLKSEVQLFNGRDLSGWHFYGRNDNASAEDAWKVEDGILKCAGRPISYLQTKKWYRDYQMELKWRFPDEKGGNSGVLVHSTTPLLFYGWPKSMEVQLNSGTAGDFWVIGKGVDLRVENESERRTKPVRGNQHKHRRILRLPGDFEKPLGQWNHMRIVCKGKEIEVYINSRLANRGTEMTIAEGGIALQSEGAPVEFKDIRIMPLSQR